MCNYGVIASGIPAEPHAGMFGNRSLLKPIKRAINRPILSVSIAQHHRQAFVS